MKIKVRILDEGEVKRPTLRELPIGTVFKDAADNIMMYTGHPVPDSSECRSCAIVLATGGHGSYYPNSVFDTFELVELVLRRKSP